MCFKRLRISLKLTLEYSILVVTQTIFEIVSKRINVFVIRSTTAVCSVSAAAVPLVVWLFFSQLP